MAEFDHERFKAVPDVVTGTLRMTEDRILLRPLEWDHGCEHILVVRHGRAVRGEVLAVGPGRWQTFRRNNKLYQSKLFRPTVVKIGEVVELGGLNIFDGKGYQFPAVIVNGEKCIVVTERDVALVRDDMKGAA